MSMERSLKIILIISTLLILILIVFLTISIQMSPPEKPILIIEDLDNQKFEDNDICSVEVSGFVNNIGAIDAEESYLKCSSKIYPINLKEDKAEKVYPLNRIDSYEKIPFKESFQIDCAQSIKFECSVYCSNC